MHPDFSKAKIEKNVRNLREQIRYMNVSMTSWEATPLRQKTLLPCKGTSPKWCAFTLLGGEKPYKHMITTRWMVKNHLCSTF